jgi:hypothetical protein
MEVSMLQIISVLGALAILGAYVANQFRLIGPSNMSYSIMNFISSAVLTVIAVIEVQWGFILLEAVWALVSLWGISTLLRGSTPRGALNAEIINIVVVSMLSTFLYTPHRNVARVRILQDYGPRRVSFL